MMDVNCHRTYNQEQLLATIQAKAQELGRTPKCKDIAEDPKLPSVYTYYTAFGSMTKALRMAGLMPNKVGRDEKYSDSQLLENLKTKAGSLGRTPTCEDMDSDPAMPSYPTYKYRFGSFQNAIKKAGLKRKKLQKRKPDTARYTEKDLIDKLSKKAKCLGRVPTQQEFNSDPDMPSFSTYVYRFGSYQAACRKANILPRKHGRRGMTDDELLGLLKNKAKELGRMPKWSDFGRKNKMPPRQVYTYRFGGIRKALRKAGI